MFRIAMFTDEPVLAAGMRALLASEDGFQLVAVLDDPDALPLIVAAERPDVLLMDCTRNVRLRLLADVRRAAPECRVVIWVRSIPAEMAYQAIELGVRGILHSTLPGAILLKYLRRIAEGELFLDGKLAAEFPGLETVHLTNRESQLLQMLARGMKNKEMASALSITEGTVKVYLSRLFQKAGVRDRYQLALYGMRNIESLGRGDLENAASPAAMMPRRGSRATPWLRSLAMSRAQ